jgi:hypothetical protein
VPQHVHVIDAVRACGHPGDQAPGFQVRIDAALAIRRDEVRQSGALRQGHHRDQSGVRYEIRVCNNRTYKVSSRTGPWKLHTPVIPGQRAPFHFDTPE